MSSMVDRGDSFHVIYLGSCMMSQASTGLGVLQKPLMDLYLKYRQPGGGPASQERYLVMSPKGMTVSYKESGATQPTQLFYGVPSILFWDAVRFITVRGSKKVMCAFEPLDNDHSRNKDNLFTVLNKNGQFLQQMTHPSLFTCVLRRTSGLKALDVHAFVCTSDDEAMGIVSALTTIYENFSAGEVHDSGVFGYKPFGNAGSTRAIGDVRRGGRHVASVFGVNDAAPVSRASSLRNLPFELSLASSSSTNSSSSAGSGNNNNNVIRQGALLSKSGGGLQLNQSHFFANSSGGSASDDLNTSSADTSPSDHVYQSLPHLDTDDEVTSRRQVARAAAAAASSRAQSNLGLSNYSSISRSLEHLEESSGSRNIQNSHASSFFRAESQSVRDLSKSAIARQVLPSQPFKLGQGYSLLSGSGSPLPGQQIHDDHERMPPPLPPPRSCSPQSSHSGSPLSSGGSIPRPSLLPQFDNRSVDGMPPHYRSPGGPGTPSSPFERPYSRLDMHQGPAPRGADPPSRPVARVPPHKVTGVRVLPTLMGNPLGQDRQFKERQKSPPYEDMDYNFISPKEQYHHFGAPKRTKSEKNLKSDKSHLENNWQFKPTRDLENGRSHSSQDKPDPLMNEKLLMNQKKDAEIAAVMQNLRFDYDAATISPGVPAGNNFEKSLGYFP